MYFLILFVVFFACIKSSYNLKDNLRLRNGTATFYELLYVLTIGLILITVAFRSTKIGTDSAQYVNRYNIIHETSSVDVFLMRGRLATDEPLYNYLNKILSYVFGDFGHIVFFMEAFFLYFGYIRTIKRYSMNVFVSLLCFLGFGMYLINLSLLRQSLTICMCTYALKYIFEKKPVKFYLVIGIACMIHFSAIFFLVAYFLGNQLKCNKRNTILILGGGGAVTFMLTALQRIVSSFFPKWSRYTNVERQAGGYVSFLIFLLITLAVIFESKRILKMSPYAPILINLNNVHMALWTMRLITRNVERISFFYMIAPILLMPYLFKAFSERFGARFGLVFKYLILMFLSAFFITKFIDDKSLYPYMFV